MGVNYGLNKVRFLKPVPVNSRLRARFKLAAFEPLDNNGTQLTYEMTVDMDGSDKPVCVADTIMRVFA
ncbi:putative enoyl-CoA hydratase 1 [compost metagenome]